MTVSIVAMTFEADQVCVHEGEDRKQETRAERSHRPMADKVKWV